MLDRKRLQDLLEYDPATGDFRRRRRNGKFAAGTTVGGASTTLGGSERINMWVDGRSYKAHRLAWLYMTGEWPAERIEHIDGDGLNNRWSNLRLWHRCALSQARLKEVLSYDPLTGLFTWRKRKGRCDDGDLAGTVDNVGYVRIGIDGKDHRAHRLAWLWMTSKWPNAEIDHIDGDKVNNRWSNLRSATRSVNQQNLRRGRGASGLLGVKSTACGTFSARIKLHGVARHLGTFATAEEAHAAYLGAKRLLHEGCTI